MKFWLLIAVFSYNGDYAGKVLQGPFPDKATCEQVQRITHNVKGDPKVMSRCLSDDHIKGKSTDPGPSLFNSPKE